MISFCQRWLIPWPHAFSIAWCEFASRCSASFPKKIGDHWWKNCLQGRQLYCFWALLTPMKWLCALTHVCTCLASGCQSSKNHFFQQTPIYIHWSRTKKLAKVMTAFRLRQMNNVDIPVVMLLLFGGVSPSDTSRILFWQAFFLRADCGAGHRYLRSIHSKGHGIGGWASAPECFWMVARGEQDQTKICLLSVCRTQKTPPRDFLLFPGKQTVCLPRYFWFVAVRGRKPGCDVGGVFAERTWWRSYLARSKEKRWEWLRAMCNVTSSKKKQWSARERSLRSMSTNGASFF